MAQQWGTIRDARTISIDDVRIAEGNAGAKNFTFTVRLDAPAEQEITVRYGTQDGTATLGRWGLPRRDGHADFRRRRADERK
jgi:hypothetical protein